MHLRSVEIAWRAAWMRTLVALLPGDAVATPPDWDARPFRVLFVRYERIGDLIMATGLIRAIARSHPTISLDVLTTPTAAPVLDGNPHVHEVLRLDRAHRRDFPRVMRELRARRYDVVVDGRINNPRLFTSTPLLMLAAGAPYRVGTDRWGTARVYNLRVPWTLGAEGYVDASAHLAEPFGVAPAETDWRPELFIAPGEARTAAARWPAADGAETGARFLVNLSASEAKRRWPDARFVAAIRHVQQRLPGVRVGVIALPAEWPSAEAVAREVSGTAMRTPLLREALALVASAELVLTPDTSISHAASAFARPAVVLLKSTHRNYAPYRTPGRVVHWEGERVDALGDEPVAGALDATMAEAGLGAAPPAPRPGAPQAA